MDRQRKETSSGGSAGAPRESPARVMIVAGEASGDLHGAHLVRSLKERAPDISVCAMGGRALREAGAEILVDASPLAVVGLVEVFGVLRGILSAFSLLCRELRRHPPDLLVLVDFPDFNLLLAARAKKRNIPVLYYISPQVWAWRRGRVRKIRRLVDAMAVILPFEREFYARHGVEVHFVGHPLLDSVASASPRSAFLRRHAIDPAATVVGLLPGSRRKEAALLLPPFLEAARDLASRRKGVVFLLPLAPTLSEEDLRRCGLGESGLEVKVITADRHAAMAACDAAIAASGTVTLELAILGVPMVVAYRVAPLTYFFGTRLVKLPHFSLVNLVAGRILVEEFLQEDATPSRLQEAISSILDDPEKAQRIRAGLKEVVTRLGRPGASARAADLALELLRVRGKGKVAD